MADGPSDNANLQNLASIQLQGVKNIGLLIQAFQTSFPGQFVPKPTNSTASGTPNQVAYDATHFYICISSNTWVRAALATF
jgi:hypothetical protein